MTRANRSGGRLLGAPIKLSHSKNGVAASAKSVATTVDDVGKKAVAVWRCLAAATRLLAVRVAMLPHVSSAFTATEDWCQKRSQVRFRNPKTIVCSQSTVY